MKKISLVLVFLTAAIFLTACRKSANTTDAANATDPAEPKKITAPAETEEPAPYAEAEEFSVSSEAKESFAVPDVWEERLDLPTAEEIETCNSTSTQRSPYIAGWLKNDEAARFTRYSADIKADYLPIATYCSPVNITLDYSSLKDQYTDVWNEGDIGMYAGLQRREADETNVGIMAFWDIYCKDEKGNVITSTPERVYPETDEDTSFDGEGEGAHTLIDYDWKPGKWYRMLIQCGTSETNGNTTVEQRVQDLETGEWTYLSKYDLGFKDIAFTGDVAVFLENFNPETSGEIRTMEMKNVRICPEGSDEWISLNEGWFLQNYDYPGSYNYGTDEDTFWIITTGVSGKDGGISEEKKLTVTN